MSDFQPVPPSSTPYTSAPEPVRSPVLSILSLVFGILGILGSFFLFGVGIVPGIAAIVLGVLGRRKEPAAKGLWLTGLITGIVAVVIGLIVLIGVIVLFSYAASQGATSTAP